LGRSGSGDRTFALGVVPFGLRSPGDLFAFCGVDGKPPTPRRTCGVPFIAPKCCGICYIGFMCCGVRRYGRVRPKSLVKVRGCSLVDAELLSLSNKHLLNRTRRARMMRVGVKLGQSERLERRPVITCKLRHMHGSITSFRDLHSPGSFTSTVQSKTARFLLLGLAQQLQ
jgi:hypothetical protein